MSDRWFEASERSDGFGSYACKWCGEPLSCHLDVEWSDSTYMGSRIALRGRCDPSIEGREVP